MSVLVRPFLRTTPGHVLQWYSPDSTRCRGAARCSHSRGVPLCFLFFFGSRSRLFEKPSPCVWKPRATPPPHPLPWGLFFCYVGAVVFSDQKHLRALFSPKPPSLLLDWREPQRGRAKTTQRASDRKAKQIGGAPFFFASASGEVT